MTDDLKIVQMVNGKPLTTPPPPISPAQLVNNHEHDGELQCSRCKKWQPLSEFYKTVNAWCEARGYSYICKTCSRESARASLAKKKAQTKGE